MRRPSYTTFGDREHPAALFLHGFLGNSKDWRDAAFALEDRFFCVCPDLPGHGASLGLSDESYAMEGAADLILRVLDELEIKASHLVGYSMGGRLALYLALRRPERCERLFIESSSPGLHTEGERAARRRLDEEKARNLETGDLGGFEKFLRDWYAAPLFSTLPDAASMARDRLSNDPAELAKSLRGMGTGSQPNLWDELPDLKVPTLAVAGDLDGKFTRIAREMEAKSPRLSTEILPGAGHNVRVEAPERYARALRSFLTATSRAA